MVSAPVHFQQLSNKLNSLNKTKVLTTTDETMIKIKLILIMLFSLLTTVTTAEELGNLSPEQLIVMQNRDNALVIDIRTEKEWNATGTIPKSQTLQFYDSDGQFDAKQWLSDLNQLKSSPEQAVILVCRSGNRSGRVGSLLSNQLGLKNIYHLSSGISGWIESGKNMSRLCLAESACQ